MKVEKVDIQYTKETQEATINDYIIDKERLEMTYQLFVLLLEKSELTMKSKKVNKK
jgi:hypothetical protein